MLLKNILESLKTVDVINFSEKDNVIVKDICFDSRKVTDGSLFVSLKGANFDGHEFYLDAIKNGAVGIVASEKLNLEEKIPLILVKDTRKALADICAKFFSYPAKELNVVGVTGTKGKTSTTFMLASILKNAGIRCGIIGTLGIIFDGEIIKTNNTTPESYYVQKYLRIMADRGIKHVFIEASSIGLKTHRLDNIFFKSAIFTNFSLDHVGGYEHKSIEEYLECKSLLFSKCKTAIVNKDDIKSSYILKKCTNCKNIITFGINNKDVDLLAYNIKLIEKGNEFFNSFSTSGKIKLKVNLKTPGKFNVYNALAATLAANDLGIKKENILKGLINFKVKGRMEKIEIPENLNFKVLIDYAHTAESLKSLLSTLKSHNPKRIVVLFGAGGNRSKSKRPEMGKVCGQLADFSIITADNSRFEKTLDIIKDIEDGIKGTNGKYVIIPKRKEAIKYALINSKEGDVIVLAGKGHETYEEINGEKLPFDERKIVKEIIEKYF